MTEIRQPMRPKDPTVLRRGECYTRKAYPGLGNRTTFYPRLARTGNTFTTQYEIPPIWRTE